MGSNVFPPQDHAQSTAKGSGNRNLNNMLESPLSLFKQVLKPLSSIFDALFKSFNSLSKKVTDVSHGTEQTVTPSTGAANAAVYDKSKHPADFSSEVQPLSPAGAQLAQTFRALVEILSSSNGLHQFGLDSIAQAAVASATDFNNRLKIFSLAAQQVSSPVASPERQATFVPGFTSHKQTRSIKLNLPSTSAPQVAESSVLASQLRNSFSYKG